MTGNKHGTTVLLKIDAIDDVNDTNVRDHRIDPGIMSGNDLLKFIISDVKVNEKRAIVWAIGQTIDFSSSRTFECTYLLPWR